MKKSKSLASILAIVLVLSLLVVSCSQATPSPTAPASAPVTTSSAAAPTKAAAPATTTSAPAASTTAATTAPATTSVAAAPSGKTYNLKFSYHTPERASIVPSYLKPWSAAIEKSSNGQIKMTHYAGESLVKIADQYDALVSGLSDIAMIETDVTSGRFPSTEFFGLPYLSDAPGITSAAYFDTISKYSANELKEVKLLGVVTISGNHYAGNKEFKTVADLKGQRIRTGGTIETDIITALGAIPVEISTADLSTAFERKMADSLFLTWSGILRFGVKDVTKYRTIGSVFTRSWIIAMNKKVWDSMSPDLQKAIMDNSGAEKSNFYSAENDKLEAEDIKAIEGSDKGAGNPPFYKLPASEVENMKKTLAPVADNWIKKNASKIPSAEIISYFNDAVKKYSK